jgi:hypothetical protein
MYEGNAPLSYYLVKHLNKFCSVFGGHFISMSILFMKEDRHYAYSLKSGRKVHLLLMPISKRKIPPILRSRQQNPSPSYTLCRLRVYGLDLLLYNG